MGKNPWELCVKKVGRPGGEKESLSLFIYNYIYVYIFIDI
jgi:hypothetical protein